MVTPERAAARPRAKTAVRTADKTDVIDRILAALSRRAPDEDVRTWAGALLANGEAAPPSVAARPGP